MSAGGIIRRGGRPGWMTLVSRRKEEDGGGGGGTWMVSMTDEAGREREWEREWERE